MLNVKNTTTMWKHPHGRGEDFVASSACSAVEETPPRAWGRLEDRVTTLERTGNTPTGVGKTLTRAPDTRFLQKHPHGRGEDIVKINVSHHSEETPPRAWGRLRTTIFIIDSPGNTPTGVGKTIIS
ncbi:conserved hypothetical protein [methanotrophic bacterial endosymbiont of Bathymodiolus sp.]|nr:conserved hypothetical protein [methanotrophic bacterial endosymbiont of Bathymodiolus sp.]